MRGTVACVLALLGALGCDQAKSLLELPRTADSRPKAAPSASGRATEGLHRPDAGSPSFPLEPRVRRAMKLAPLRVHEQGVALGKGRVAVLEDDALAVRSTMRSEDVLRFPMHQPRTLAVTADGSFLAADDIHTLWLLWHDAKPHRLPRLVMLPTSSLFADRQTVDRFWVTASKGDTLFGYELAATTLPLLVARDWISLDGYDGRLFASLRDGSFLYSTSAGLRQFYGPNRKEDVDAPVGYGFRLLPGSRVDTVWLVAKDKATLHRLLFGKLRPLKTVEFSAMALDVDADGEYLAALELVQTENEPWSFTLEVFDVTGKRRLKEPFSAEESLDPNGWARALLQNRHLSIRADDPPLVAVGGPDELTVLRADDGTRVLTGR